MNELVDDVGQDSFGKSASQALRLTRKGSFEQLPCQHLVVSVASDALTKVRLVCEVAYMVPIFYFINQSNFNACTYGPVTNQRTSHDSAKIASNNL